MTMNVCAVKLNNVLQVATVSLDEQDSIDKFCAICEDQGDDTEWNKWAERGAKVVQCVLEEATP